MPNDSLRDDIVSVRVNADFTESELLLKDESRICFCHRVGERWAKAVDQSLQESPATLAGRLLLQISMFRLNAKHLEIWFEDKSRWEWSFRDRTTGPAQR